MKNIFVLAASALLLLTAGCSKKQVHTTPGAPRDLKVKITGAIAAFQANQAQSQTRSTEAGMQAGQITVANGHIFVLDAAGNVMDKSLALASEAITPTGQLISQVPADAQIYVLANIPADVDVTALTTWEQIKTATSTISATAHADYKAPFMANATAEPAAITKQTETTGTANIAISPLYTRFEIGRVTGSSTLTGFTVAAVVMDSYYPSFTLAGKAAGTLVVQNPLEELTGFGDFGTWTAEGSAAPKTATAGTDKVWAYHVGPGSLPVAIVKLTGVTTSDTSTYPGGFADPQYLTVTGYQDFDTPIERGKVYKIEQIDFSEANLSATPGQGLSVTATITVEDWVPVVLVPELGR